MFVGVTHKQTDEAEQFPASVLILHDSLHVSAAGSHSQFASRLQFAAVVWANEHRVAHEGGFVVSFHTQSVFAAHDVCPSSSGHCCLQIKLTESHMHETALLQEPSLV